MAKQEFLEDFESVTNVDEFFKCVSKHYDTKSTKFGAITKATLKVNFDRLALMLQLKPKK